MGCSVAFQYMPTIRNDPQKSTYVSPQLFLWVGDIKNSFINCVKIFN